MLSELSTLLSACPAESTPADYRAAIVEDNVLAKKTLNSRQRTHRYLRELYALDPAALLFRALRDLWPAEPDAQPLLAMLCAHGLTAAIMDPFDEELMATVKTCDIMMNKKLYADDYLKA